MRIKIPVHQLLSANSISYRLLSTKDSVKCLGISERGHRGSGKLGLSNVYPCAWFQLLLVKYPSHFGSRSPSFLGLMQAACLKDAAISA